MTVPRSRIKSLVFLVLVLIIGGFMRFYKLDWGEGYFFHPDERNIANLAISIKPPFDSSFFTKGTYAYGSFVPYLVYGVKFLHQFIFSPILPQNDFVITSLILRAISAICSTLSILLIYFVGKRFWSTRVAFVSAMLVALSPGLVQSAHFGTFEAVLSFLYVLVFFLTLKFARSYALRDFFLAIFFVAVASAIKVNSAVLMPIPFLILLVSREGGRRFRTNVFSAFLGSLLFIFSVVLFSPYYLTEGFRSMLDYERSVVIGEIGVFYTNQFFETIPIVFQFLKILPFITNPLVVMFLPFSLVCYLQKLHRKPRKYYNRTPLACSAPEQCRACPKEAPQGGAATTGSTLWHAISASVGDAFRRQFSSEFILFYFLGVLFLPNAFLFTKWTRYIIPAVPFLILFITVSVEKFARRGRNFVFICWGVTSTLWSLAFMSIYFSRDTRLASSEWMRQVFEDGSFLLSETGNVVDVPLSLKGDVTRKHFTVKNFDFYNLENDVDLLEELLFSLEKANYILIPSHRLFAGMGRMPQRYPLISRYYELLFSGSLGFNRVAEFSSYPKLEIGNWKLEIPDEMAEGTWSVFDHPVVRVYKKVRPLRVEDYEKLLQT